MSDGTLADFGQAFPSKVHELLASAARTTSGTGTAKSFRVAGHQGIRAVLFLLDVTATLTIATDTLDVVVEARIGTSHWFQVAAFTQSTGSTGAQARIHKIVAGLAEGEVLTTLPLSAPPSVRHLLGEEYRAKWTIVAGATPIFTFSVQMAAI